MRKWFVNVMVLLLGLGLATSAPAQENKAQEEKAQEDERPEMRAKVIKDADSGVAVTRPEGWVLGKKKGGGAIAVFRAAGDPEAQIDVLVSELKRDSAATAYFTSFHANLQKAGLVKSEVRKEATYEGKKGLETEYEASSKNRKFRLIVWQFHQGDKAVLITGFFPGEKRDKYYADFQAVLEALALE